MKRISIAYWHSKVGNLPYEHLQEFEYSEEKRNEIINTVLAQNLSIMLRPMPDSLIIWIDNGRFGQR